MDYSMTEIEQRIAMRRYLADYITDQGIAPTTVDAYRQGQPFASIPFAPMIGSKNHLNVMALLAIMGADLISTLSDGGFTNAEGEKKDAYSLIEMKPAEQLDDVQVAFTLYAYEMEDRNVTLSLPLDMPFDLEKHPYIKDMASAVSERVTEMKSVMEQNDKAESMEKEAQLTLFNMLYDTRPSLFGAGMPSDEVIYRAKADHSEKTKLLDNHPNRVKDDVTVLVNCAHANSPVKDWAILLSGDLHLTQQEMETIMSKVSRRSSDVPGKLSSTKMKQIIMDHYVAKGYLA